MAKAKAILKDFSELKPIEQRIEAAALGLFQLAFRGSTNPDFKPKDGTQVHRIWRAGKLTERQAIAWQAFIDDVNLAHGKSGSVTAAYGETIQSGNGDGLRAPTAFTNIYYERLQRLFRECLTREERALLYDLLQDTLRRSSFRIEDIGWLGSGYKNDPTALASGTTHCQCLLNRLCSFYQI